MILIAVIKRNKKCLYTLLELFREYSIKRHTNTKIKLHFPLHFNKINYLGDLGLFAAFTDAGD